MDTSLVAVIDDKIEGLFRSEAKEDVVIELNTMKFMENLYLKSNKHKRCFLFLENDTIYVYYWKDNVTDVTEVYVFGFGLELKGHKKDCFSKFCDIVSTQKVIFDNKIISKIYDRYNAIIPFDKNWCKKNPLRLLHYLAAQFGKEEEELFYNCGLFDIAFYFHRIEEINLLATTPSGYLDGVNMHVLRCLDSESGVSMVLKNEYSRRRLKELYRACPDLFKNKFNEGQCFYFSEAIEKTDIWCKDQIKIFREMSHYVTESLFVKYLFYLEIREELLEVNSQLTFPIVPICEDDEELEDVIDRIMFFHALVLSEYKIQISYPQRMCQVPIDYYFEDEQFIIREPKDLEEILVESLSQHNCLYEYPIHEKESIILFLRSKKRGIDVPYVDVEIKANQLIQMKTKYNREVSPGVREFVRNYCVRKKIEFCF